MALIVVTTSCYGNGYHDNTSSATCGESPEYGTAILYIHWFIYTITTVIASSHEVPQVSDGFYQSGP